MTMVMPTDAPQTEAPTEVADQATPALENADEPIADIQVFGGEDEAPVGEAAPDAVSPPSPEPAPVVEAPLAPAPVSEADREREEALKELETRREAEVQRTWEQQVVRKAKALEQQLSESGYLPEQAKAQARQFVQQERRFRQKDKESADVVGYVQGKQAAAIHFMKQHGLADEQMLADFMALQQAQSPADMEREATRMKRERALVAENARLRQGRVAPQTFDNSQGSAEVTTNQDRLLQAYRHGDRSPAANEAAKKISFGA
jgi:hypothetical protein